MRQSHPEGFCDDLSSGGGAKELTSPSRRAAGATGGFRGSLEIDFVVSKPGTHRLNLGEVLSFLGEEGNSPRHQNAGQVTVACKSHHHGG